MKYNIKTNLITGVDAMNKAFSATVNKDLNINVLKALHSEHSPIREIIFELITEMVQVCMPQCEYRGGVCHEFTSCGEHRHYSTFNLNTIKTT